MIGVFYHHCLTLSVSCGAAKKTHSDSDLCSCVCYTSVWACWSCFVLVCWGGGGDYSNINAGSVGETVCLLINE